MTLVRYWLLPTALETSCLATNPAPLHLQHLQQIHVAGVVKMRRGQTACIFDETYTMCDVYRWFVVFLRVLQDKVNHEVAGHDPTRPVSILSRLWRAGYVAVIDKVYSLACLDCGTSTCCSSQVAVHPETTTPV